MLAADEDATQVVGVMAVPAGRVGGDVARHRQDTSQACFLVFFSLFHLFNINNTLF